MIALLETRNFDLEIIIENDEMKMKWSRMKTAIKLKITIDLRTFQDFRRHFHLWVSIELFSNLDELWKNNFQMQSLLSQFYFVKESCLNIWSILVNKLLMRCTTVYKVLQLPIWNNSYERNSICQISNTTSIVLVSIHVSIWS